MSDAFIFTTKRVLFFLVFLAVYIGGLAGFYYLFPIGHFLTGDAVSTSSPLWLPFLSIGFFLLWTFLCGALLDFLSNRLFPHVTVKQEKSSFLITLRTILVVVLVHLVLQSTHIYQGVTASFPQFESAARFILILLSLQISQWFLKQW